MLRLRSAIVDHHNSPVIVVVDACLVQGEPTPRVVLLLVTYLLGLHCITLTSWHLTIASRSSSINSPHYGDIAGRSIQT